MSIVEYYGIYTCEVVCSNTEAYPVTSLLSFLCVTVSHKSAGEECESCEPEYDEDMAEFVHPHHEAME